MPAMGDTCCYIFLCLRLSLTQQVKYTVPYYSHLVSWTRMQGQNTFILVQPYITKDMITCFFHERDYNHTCSTAELEDQPTSTLPCIPLQSCYSVHRPCIVIPSPPSCALDWLAEAKWSWRKIQWAERGKLQVPSAPPSIGLVSMASVQDPYCTECNVNVNSSCT
jgi:hypothetical protein